jgi:hypothetical protein
VSETVSKLNSKIRMIRFGLTGSAIRHQSSTEKPHRRAQFCDL